MRTLFLSGLLLIAAAASARCHAGQQGAPAKTEAATQTPVASADADTIRHNIALYAKSIDAADTTLAAQIWWDSPEVSFIHPLGHEHGFAQIKQNVYERLMGGTFSERKLTPRDITIH